MIRIFLFSFILLSIWIMPFAVLAQEGRIEYRPLVELPINFGDGGADGEPTTEDYVRILYTLSITVAALLAVVKIIFGGVKYMLSDVVTNKASAKKDIQGALLGLLIVVGAVLILETINPQITQLNLLGNAPGVDIELTNHPEASRDSGRDAVQDVSANCPSSIGTVESRSRGQSGPEAVCCLHDRSTKHNLCQAYYQELAEEESRDYIDQLYSGYRTIQERDAAIASVCQDGEVVATGGRDRNYNFTCRRPE